MTEQEASVVEAASLAASQQQAMHTTALEHANETSNSSFLSSDNPSASKPKNAEQQIESSTKLIAQQADQLLYIEGLYGKSGIDPSVREAVSSVVTDVASSAAADHNNDGDRNHSDYIEMLWQRSSISPDIRQMVSSLVSSALHAELPRIAKPDKAVKPLKPKESRHVSIEADEAAQGSAVHSPSAQLTEGEQRLLLDAAEKTKHWRAEAEDRKRRLREIQEAEDERQRQVLEDMERRRREELHRIEERKKAEKEARRLKRQQDMEERRAEREKLLELERELRVKQGDRPRHEIMEDEFKEKFVMPELERRKRELAERRKAFAPLNKREMDEHAKKIDEELRAKETQKTEERRSRLAQELSQMPKPSISRTRASEMLIQEERERRLRAEAEEQERKAKLEKSKQYGKLVREMYVPSIDEEKRMEVEVRKEKAKHAMPARKARPSETVGNGSISSPHKPNTAASWSGHEGTQEPRQSSQDDPGIMSEAGSAVKPRQNRKPKRKTVAEPLPTLPSPNSEELEKRKAERKKADQYLQQRRYQREEKDRERKSSASPVRDNKWQQEFLNPKLTHEQKLDLVQTKTREMERIASEKELNGQTDETAEIYVDAIKAKLSLLEQLNH
eukprot:GILK01005000.1.p1 GENE.GILK01005000.1~~GILK01005000.1.p1  ORF type:complete len:639 (-),score=175.63 GILK01005000.1:41-1900(-)